MKLKCSVWGVLVLLSILAIGGVGCTGAEVIGAVAEITVGVFTDDMQLAAAAGAAVQANAEKQQEVNFITAQLPPEEKMEGGRVSYSSDQNCYFYERPNQRPLVWAEGKWMLAE